MSMITNIDNASSKDIPFNTIDLLWMTLCYSAMAVFGIVSIIAGFKIEVITHQRRDKSWIVGLHAWSR